MSLDAYPKDVRDLVFQFVRQGRPHEDFPACYQGNCACEHRERQRVGELLGRILDALTVDGWHHDPLTCRNAEHDACFDAQLDANYGAKEALDEAAGAGGDARRVA